jgi:hypothetical protein
MLAYKSPNIASGATPIGSAERAPDRDEMSSMEDEEGLTNKGFGYISRRIIIELKKLQKMNYH